MNSLPATNGAHIVPSGNTPAIIVCHDDTHGTPTTVIVKLSLVLVMEEQVMVSCFDSNSWEGLKVPDIFGVNS